MRRKTKHRGVTWIGGTKYEVIAWWTDPKTGRERKLRRTIDARSPKDAAQQREALRDEEVACVTRAERKRLGPAARSWLTSKLSAWKKSTRTNAADVLDRHIIPGLGDFYVDAITADDIAAWRDRMTGSPTTINSRMRLLKQLLSDVCAELRIPSPAARVPGVRVPLDEARAVHYLDASEASAVLAWLRSSEEWRHRYPLVALLALTGLSFGEATALRWTDVDEERGWIHVRRAQWKGHVDHPKAIARRRDVPLAPELAAILREHRSAMQARASKRATRRNEATPLETGYVFTGNTGALHHNSIMTKPVKAALAACGIAGRFPAAHGWRKVHNNILRTVTDEVVRQALIGHADAAVGAKHYSKASDEELRRANANVVRLVTGGG